MNMETIKNQIKTLNVLFVDDEEFVVNTMKDVLPMFFNDSYFATNGEEGYKLSRQYDIDIVITDLSMPIMNGYDMAIKIKNENPNIKMVFVSGHNEEPCKEKIKKINGAFIVKPISSKGLFNAIEETL